MDRKDWFKLETYEITALRRAAFALLILIVFSFILFGCTSNVQKCAEWGAGAPGSPGNAQCTAQLYGKRTIYDALLGN